MKEVKKQFGEVFSTEEIEKVYPKIFSHGAPSSTSLVLICSLQSILMASFWKLQALKEHKPAVMFITHGESSGTTVQPLEGIGRACHK